MLHCSNFYKVCYFAFTIKRVIVRPGYLPFSYILLKVCVSRKQLVCVRLKLWFIENKFIMVWHMSVAKNAKIFLWWIYRSFFLSSIKAAWFLKVHSSTKGQIKPKADLRAVDSPKKRTNEFVLFAFHGKQNKFFRSIFGRIYGAPKLPFVLSDL